MIIYGAFEHAQKGVGKGSGLFDNYDTRNKDNDWNTEFLLEDKTYSNKYKLNFQYLLSINLNFRTTIVINNNEYFSNISEKLKRTEKTFIVGLDFNL
jgi:hypothetical protein